MIILSDFPFPPSSNHIFVDKMRFDPHLRRMVQAGGKRKSDEYVAFEKQVDHWVNQRLEIIETCREVAVLELAHARNIARVDLLFAVPAQMRPEDHFPVERRKGVRRGPPAVVPMFTSKAKPEFRVWDVSNRIKAAHDQIAEVLRIPDHRMNVGLAEKVLIDDNGPHGVTIKISFHRVRTWSEAFSDLERE